MSTPAELHELGLARQKARQEKNFALADQIRDQLLALGWEVLDTPTGFDFREKAKFPKYEHLKLVKPLDLQDYSTAVCMIVDGFIDDFLITVQSIKAHTNAEVAIVVLVNGDVDLTPATKEMDDRTFFIQVVQQAGWGDCANTLIKISVVNYLFIMDPSTIFDGDAITPVLSKFASGDWSAIGWKGGLINVDDQWRSVIDVGAGEVDVLFSYFFGVNRQAALDADGFNSRAMYYRNADIEFSLRLRQVRGRLLQLDLPLRQGRHHGYYDVEESYRELQSKRNYDRILDRFRGKNEILAPRR